MKARQLIGGASFGPDALKVIWRAFDDAWAEIAPNITGRAQGIEAARLKLANIVLSLARDNSHDPLALKNDAVRSYRLQHRATS
jgi:hypothetical protein